MWDVKPVTFSGVSKAVLAPAQMAVLPSKTGPNPEYSPPVTSARAAHVKARFLPFGSVENGHRDLTYSLTPDRLIPGGIWPDLAVHSLTDPKTGVKQEVYLLHQPGVGLATAGTLINRGSFAEFVPGEKPILPNTAGLTNLAAQQYYQTNGLFHFTEHMLFKRTGDGKGGTQYQNGAFDRFLERNLFGINAFTSWDTVAYYLYNGPKEKLAAVLKAHALFMQDPKFDSKELNDERGTVVEEIQMYDDNLSSRLSNQLFRDLYAPHTYALPILGPAQNIKTLPQEVFQEFYFKHYGPQNRKILVIGDFDKKEVLDTLAKNMNLAPERYKNEPFPELPQPAARDTVIRKTLTEKSMDPQDARTIWAWRGPRATEVKDKMTLDIISLLLGGSDASGPYQELVNTRKWANDFSAGTLDLKDKAGSLIEIDINGKADKQEQIEKRLAGYVEQIRSGKTTPADLALMKTRMKTGYLYGPANPRAHWGDLGEKITNGTIDQLYGDKYLKLLASITLGDIQRVAQQYLVPGRKVEYQVLSKAAEAPGGSANKPGTVKFSGTLRSDDVSFKTPQGSQVILRRPLPGEQRLAMTITLPGGNSIEQYPGELDLMANLMEKMTRPKNPAVFARFLAQHGLTVNAKATPEALHFSLSGDSCKLDGDTPVMNDPTGFQRMTEIATEILTRPTFPAHEVKGEAEQVTADYRQMVSERPAQVAATQHLEEFFSPDNRHAVTTRRIVEEGLPHITPKLLRQRHQQLFRPEKMTISVVTNLPEVEVRAQINQMTAAIGKRNGRYKTMAGKLPVKPGHNPNLTENVMITRVRQEGELKQTQIFRSWAAPSMQDKEASLVLSLLGIVMSGGISSRMFQTFREGEHGGLCYSTSASYSPGAKDGGRLTFYIGTQHDNVPLVLKLFDGEMEKLLGAKPVTQEELDWAKASFRKSEQVAAFSVESQSGENAGHIALDYPSRHDKYQLLDTLTLERFNAIVHQLFSGKKSLTTLLTNQGVPEMLNLQGGTLNYDTWKAQHQDRLITEMAAKKQAALAEVQQKAGDTVAETQS